MANHDIISYAKRYLGVPYRSWDPAVSCYGDSGPFWAFEGAPPPLSRIKKELMNCAGFMNVLCRHLGIKIPGTEDESYYAGGTYEWYVYLDGKKKLHPFVEGKDYPVGSLLLRRYKSEEDQGHLAIVFGPKKVIHSYSEKGVTIDRIYEKYYEFVSLPGEWIQ
jgi:cell wall-associated NlpC family hydrolase